jgi:hypothetical protein
MWRSVHMWVILVVWWAENPPRRGANSRNELTRKETEENTYTTEEYKTRTQIGVMQPSYRPITPISLMSSPFYRPVTITLYNSCHHFFTSSEKSQRYFGNLTGPVPSHFTDVLHLVRLRVWSRGTSLFDGLLFRPEPRDPLFVCP